MNEKRVAQLGGAATRGVAWPSWPCGRTRAGRPCHVACRGQRRWPGPKAVRPYAQLANSRQKNKHSRAYNAEVDVLRAPLRLIIWPRVRSGLRMAIKRGCTDRWPRRRDMPPLIGLPPPRPQAVISRWSAAEEGQVRPRPRCCGLFSGAANEGSHYQ
jgi:hypothetical protein